MINFIMDISGNGAESDKQKIWRGVGNAAKVNGRDYPEDNIEGGGG